MAVLPVALGGCGGSEEEVTYGAPLTNAQMNEMLDMWEDDACEGQGRDRYAADDISDDAEARASCDIGYSVEGENGRQVVSLYATPAGRAEFVDDRDCSQQYIVYGDIWVATTMREDVADRLVAAGGTLCEA